MYHHIADGRTNTTISAENFEAHIKALHDAGYNTVTVKDMIEYVYSGTDLPEKPVCITFDDGYLSNYETAYPILKKYDMTATVFAIGVSVGATEHYKATDYPITPHFSFEQAREMISSGIISVQSHTYDMHQWEPYELGSRIRVNATKLENESEKEYIAAILNDCKIYDQLMLDNCGEKFTAFAYPSGAHSILGEVVIHSYGIKVTFSTQTDVRNTLVKGIPQSLYALCRYNMSDSVSAEDLPELLLK